jgi:hypothetical protein
MPTIRIEIDQKALQRNTEFTFDPGDHMEITIDGRDVMSEWVSCEAGSEDPGVTVGQAEVLKDLLTGTLTLELDDSGKLSLVEE